MDCFLPPLLATKRARFFSEPAGRTVLLLKSYLKAQVAPERMVGYRA